MKEGESKRHESFGLLSLYRTSNNNGTSLFGSSIKHNNTIILSIKRAEKNRNLNYDRYHEREKLIEIEMSPTQFSDAITSLNIGPGIPVTLRYVDKKNMENCPEVSVREQFQNEFKNHVNEISENLKKLNHEAEELLTKKSTLKIKEKEQLLNIIKRISMEVIENTPFIQKQFNRSMDGTIKEAKGEIEGFLTNIITSLGVKSLKDSKNLIDVNNQPNLKIENDRFICCGIEMKPVGLEDCNGWLCEKCNKEIPDIVSFKINEDKYYQNELNEKSKNKLVKEKE